MKRLGKVSVFLTVIGLLGLLTFPTFSRVEAATDGPNPYIAYDGYEYQMGSKSTAKKVYWQHYHTNSSGITDTVSFTASRTKSSSASVSSSASFSSMVTEVGISNEVSWGTSTSVSTTVSYQVPAYSTYLLRYGSMMVNTSGYELYYSRGILQSKKYVTGNWSYAGFSDKIQQ